MRNSAVDWGGAQKAECEGIDQLVFVTKSTSMLMELVKQKQKGRK